MHFFNQARVCSQGEISIILQQDFYSLRVEIPEAELFVPSSVCFSVRHSLVFFCFFFFFSRNAINDHSEIVRSADKRDHS